MKIKPHWGDDGEEGRERRKNENSSHTQHTMCTTIATSSRSKIRWRQSTDGEHDDRRRKRANQTTSGEKSEEENFNFVSLITSTDVVFNYFVLTAQAAVRGAGKTSGELEIEPRKEQHDMKKETMGYYCIGRDFFSWQFAQLANFWWASSELFSYCFVRCLFLIR